MEQEKMSPLRARMMEDMRIRGMGDKAQKSHIRAIKDFAKFLGRSPDAATSDDLRAYQLHLTDTGVTPSTFNTRIVALRFFFGITCGREDSAGGNRKRSSESFSRQTASCSSRPSPRSCPWCSACRRCRIC